MNSRIMKTLLITGGTGSFGHAVLDSLNPSDFDEIRIFSRDEKKQNDMRTISHNLPVTFHIGDVRDKSSVDWAMSGVTHVFHAAALKQVPSCEFFPLQAVHTNILGTENVIRSAINHSVERVICLSTDKAVYPINAMGLTKSLMEKATIAASRDSRCTTSFSVTRYGNVMASRGSVIPLFKSQLLTDKPLTITNPNMTRFMMSLDDAVNLVKYALSNGKSGFTYIKKSSSCTISDLAKAMCIYFGKPNHPIVLLGPRHGEKLYESLMSSEESQFASDLGDYYEIPADDRTLDYSSYETSGSSGFLDHTPESYNSHNSDRLNIQQLIAKFDEINLASE